MAPLVFISTLLVAGCGGDDASSLDSTDGNASSTAAASSDDDVDSTTAAPDEPTAGDGGMSDGPSGPPPGSDGGSAGGTGGDGFGVCVPTCTVAEDCCSIGDIGCPGDYPHNWSCEEGVCQRSECTSDDDCSILFPGLLRECHEVWGIGACVNPCTEDADCVKLLAPNGECTGMSDDGQAYCNDPEQLCGSDADCGEVGVCDEETGRCGCTTDDECTGELVCG